MPGKIWEYTCSCEPDTFGGGVPTCPECGQTGKYSGWHYSAVECWGINQRLYGLKGLGPHLPLARELFSEVIRDCTKCQSTGLLDVNRGESYQRCPDCNGLGSIFTASADEISAIRQRVLEKYPDAAVRVDEEEGEKEEEEEKLQEVSWEEARESIVANFVQLLESTFRTPRFEFPFGKIFVPSEPVDVEEAVKELAISAGVYDEEEDTWDGVDTALGEAYQTRRLVQFITDSFGPMSSSISLDFLEIDTTRAYIILRADDVPDLMIAALEPKDSEELFSKFFASLTVEGGAAYHGAVLDSLPSLTENYRPDLIPAEVIKDSYWNWMEWYSVFIDPGCWTRLRNEVIGVLVEPNHLKRSLDILKDALRKAPRLDSSEEISEYHARRKQEIEEKAREAASLSYEDRRRILDNYFSASYREQN